MSGSGVTINWGDISDLEKGIELRQALDRIGFQITAHAIPHCGVDTGRLVNSMTHGVFVEQGEAVLYCGSNAHDPSLQPVHYASDHWRGEPDPDNTRPKQNEIRGRKKNQVPKKTPTTPYAKALRALGITVNWKGKPS